MHYLENTSSYVIEKDRPNFSWDGAQESTVNIMEQQCRIETAAALKSAAELVEYVLC